MKFNNIFNKEFLFIIFLLFFSLAINQYYGNKGVFPADSFSHFDSGFRVLLGEFPFKDYWVVSGPFIDYVQAIFFYLFGVHWQVYVLHASAVNGITTIATFLFLRNFKLNIFYCFAYSLFFSILAYPSSGTPFVDHHSSLFSLLAIYILILAIKNEKTYYWFILPFLLGFAFLSKQVPASYVFIFVILILLFYFFIKKKYKYIKQLFLGTVLFIFSLLFIGKVQEITLSNFLEQYIFYPQTIGQNRFENYEITFNGLIGHFKYIYFALFPLIFINLKKIFLIKNYYKEKDFIYFLLLTGLTFALIFHQLFTRNQTFIFFLIPILVSFLHISLQSHKKFVQIILILFCLFVTIKYHLRFNENRKFHELNYSDFKLSSDAEKIDEKFSGLNWITPSYKNYPEEEINLINEVKKYLKGDNRKKMLLTNYSFFSVVLEKSSLSTSRWHIFDGTDYPQKNSKYFKSYKNLLINSIKRNSVEVIFTIHPVKNSNIYDYINKDCFEEKRITKILISYELKHCSELEN